MQRFVDMRIVNIFGDLDFNIENHKKFSNVFEGAA